MLELDRILQQIETLDRVLGYIRRRNIEIFDAAASAKLIEFKAALLAIKSDLIQIRRRLRKLKASLRKEASEQLSNMERQIDDFHRNVAGMARDVISPELDILKVQFSTVKGVLPMTELELQLNKVQILEIVPRAIRGEIKASLEEVEKCYSVQSYRGVMAFCGTILEIGLGRKYYEIKRRRREVATIEDAERQIAGLTLGGLATKCSNDNVIRDIPGLNQNIAIITGVRNPSLHHRRVVYVPGPDAAKGSISFTIEALKTMFS